MKYYEKPSITLIHVLPEQCLHTASLDTKNPGEGDPSKEASTNTNGIGWEDKDDDETFRILGSNESCSD